MRRHASEYIRKQLSLRRRGWHKRKMKVATCGEAGSMESVLSREAAKDLFKDIKSVYANENQRRLLLQMRTNLSLDVGQLADSWLI